MQDFGFVFAGFFVGVIVGLTGVGGGSLMTPLLIFFFGVKPYHKSRRHTQHGASALGALACGGLAVRGQLARLSLDLVGVAHRGAV
jgi:uncharacterized membrane protein YfcA